MRAELLSINHDDEMDLVARREAGSVQASVALATHKMPTFHKLFMVDCAMIRISISLVRLIVLGQFDIVLEDL